MKKSNRELFDDMAPDYDSIYSRGVDLKENKYIYSKLKKMLAGKSVLDIGCGTASILNYIPIEDYTGSDISWKMIQVAVLNDVNDRRNFYVESFEQSMQKRALFHNAIISTWGVINHLETPIPILKDKFYFLLGWTEKQRPDSPGHMKILSESRYYIFATPELYPELKCVGFNSLPDHITERAPYWVCKLWWSIENFFIKDKTKFFHLVYYGKQV